MLAWDMWLSVDIIYSLDQFNLATGFHEQTFFHSQLNNCSERLVSVYEKRIWSSNITCIQSQGHVNLYLT